MTALVSAACSVTALIVFLGMGLASPASQAPLHRLVSLSVADMPKELAGARIEVFDLSPDGNSLAAELSRSETPSTLSLWVAKWNVATGKLAGMMRVEGPGANKDVLPNAQYRLDLRFTPDARGLVVQTGRRIVRLDAQALVPNFAIPAAPNPNTSGDLGIRAFAVSGDGKWLAMLSAVPTYVCDPVAVGLFDVESGAKAAQWALPRVCAKSIALSWTGDRVVLSRIDSVWPDAADVLVADSRSGQIVTAIDAGYGGHGAALGVNRAAYLGRGRIVTIGSLSVASTLKVWDAGSGRLVHELKYAQFGISGDSVAVAADAPVVAVITSEVHRPVLKLTDGLDKSVHRLLLFHADDAAPFYISPGLKSAKTFYGPSVSTSVLRLSADGSRLALMQGGAVEVYDVTPSR